MSSESSDEHPSSAADAACAQGTTSIAEHSTRAASCALLYSALLCSARLCYAACAYGTISTMSVAPMSSADGEYTSSVADGMVVRTPWREVRYLCTGRGGGGAGMNVPHSRGWGVWR